MALTSIRSSLGRGHLNLLPRIYHSTFALRCYHSYDHPSPPPYSSTANAILSAAIPHIPSHGFTQASLQLGAKDAGYLAISTNLFPRGPFDLVLYYLVTRRLALKDVAHGEEGLAKGWAEKKFGPGRRVRDLLLERLRMNGKAELVTKLPEAISLIAQPTHTPSALKELGQLSDEIWFLAGDSSVDTSWYTKRASLAGLYAAAEIYQTQDTSTDFVDTERFVDARLDEMRIMEQNFNSMAEWISFSGHAGINVLRSWGLRI